MPGSWNQSSRELIEDIKNTLRLHFKRVVISNSPLKLIAIIVDYRFNLTAISYGGLVFPQALKIEQAALQMTVQAKALCARITGQTRATPLFLQILTVQSVPIGFENTRTRSESILTSQGNVQSIPLESLKAPKIQSIARTQFQSKPRTAIYRLNSKLAYKVKIRELEGVKSNIVRLKTPQLTFPIVHQPIPAHRFNQAKRNQFREALAKKANLFGNDIKIVQVYDRVYLPLYQSISQLPDGTLACIPQIPPKTTQAVASYLVLGAPIADPRQAIQVAVPMQDAETSS